MPTSCRKIGVTKKNNIMKSNLIAIAIFVLAGVSISAQESLIADIMQVDPVNLTIGEEAQKMLDKYETAYTEELGKLDELLAKQGEDYAEEVTKLIEGFTGSMEKGEEQVIKNEKQNVATMTNAKTFTLLKDKKKSIQDFHNKMNIMQRDLPKEIMKEKGEELNNLVEDYKSKITEEFSANQRVIKAFKATEHITKTNVKDMPSSDDGSN